MGNSPGMLIDPNGEMTKYAEDLNFGRNDWLMNAPEHLAWLMGGSKSTVGSAAQKLFALLYKSDNLSERGPATKASESNYNSGSVSPIGNLQSKDGDSANSWHLNKPTL